MTDTTTDRAIGDVPPNYTTSQWDAVVGCDRHLLVSAGAGTGKTHTVVGRLLWLLGVRIGTHVNDSPLRMRDVAAITYTNQAAADLKRRLRAELRGAGRRDLAREVDAARVGTIHSFCDDVLREFSLRGGVAPGTRILEDGEGKALIAECAHDTLVEALEGGKLDGLEELLSDFGVRDVERWMARLAGDADRLRHLTGSHEASGSRERALLWLAGATLTTLGERLREQRVVDFDRMIVATRDLIRDDPGVRGRLRRHVRTLIVDEFQDVDPVQRDIAFMLGGIDEHGGEEPIDATRLMLVGDPKQSIYRFRRADVAVWNDVERRFGAGGCGRVIHLVDNRRSVSPVLAFVEEFVGPMLDAPVDGETGERQAFEVPFTPVRAVRTDAPSHAGVEFLVVPRGEDGKAATADRARALEAAAVAARMAELHASEGIPWNEMAILLPSWTSLAIYRDALRQRGIPTYALRSKGFYESRAVLDVLLALQVARDPRDDRALTGFLRGPFVGVRDDTLLAIARGCQRPYWDHLEGCEVVDDEERALVVRGSQMVRRLAALRDRMPVGDLVEELVHESGFLAHLALLGDEGVQGVANVRKLLAELHARRDVSVGDLLRQVEESRARREEIQQARLYGAGEDVVTITSIHGAKGLEWGVVFWCDTTRAPRPDSEKLVVGRDGIMLGDPDEESKDQDVGWRALRERGQQEELAEVYRLWYVAATRAKDLLVLAGMAYGKGARLKGTIAGRLADRYPALAEEAERTVTVSGMGCSFDAPVRLAGAEALAAEEGAEGDALQVGMGGEEWLRPSLAPLVVPGGLGRHSATSLMAAARCPRRHWMRYTLGLGAADVVDSRLGAEPDRTGADGDGRPAPVTHGQVMHDVLEHLREDADLELLLDNALERWDAEGEGEAEGERRSEGARVRWRERLLEEIGRIASDPAYSSIADLPSARHELPFLHVVSESAWLTGSMDLAAADEEGIVVLDVKTSRVSGDEEARAVAARYDIQRDVYSAAASAISGLPVSRFVFHFTSAGIQVDGGPAGDGAWRALAACGEPPAMTRDPRECVRCGYRAAGWCPGVSMIPTPRDPAASAAAGASGSPGGEGIP